MTMLLGVVCSRDARSAPSDPAARGLDAYVELPSSAPAGSKIIVALRTFGFPTAVEPAPLGEVNVEAVWRGSDALPASIVTDRDGLASLELTVPDGKTEAASLLLAFSQGGHRRTRTFEIARAPKLEIELHIQEREVTPGSRIPAWVLVRDLETGAPAPNVDVMLKLSEGGVDRTVVALHTDAAGAASTVLPIPDAEDPSFGWKLRADTVGSRSNMAFADLVPREDVPAQATLVAGFEAARLPAGSKTAVHVRLSSATGDGIARAKLKYLFTDGDETPDINGEKWKKEAKTASADEAGELVIPYDVPTLGFEKEKRFTVRADVDGRERQATSVLQVVGKVAPTVELYAEAGSIAPGLEQLLIVRAKDGWNKPVSGAELHVEGDGLHETVTTDSRGIGEIHWKVPKDVGASRKVGPCSGEVAATVSVSAVRGASPELLAAGPVSKCLDIQRSSLAIAKPNALVVRSGESVGIEMALADGVRREPTSIRISGARGANATETWVKSDRGDVRLPSSAGGLFVVSASSPRSDGPSVVASTPIVVKPRVLPKLTSRITGGRLAPGGDVEIEAKLLDEAGAPLAGSVTGILYDRFARVDETIPPEFDTRLAICARVQIEPADCDAVLAKDPTLMPLLQASLAQQGGDGSHIVSDPGGSAKEEMRRTFNAVLKNLEGVVFESSSSSETLRDVLRKGGRGNEFNPEIMTLVTAVLSAPPMTPGGEPFTLADLRALDPQVDYDTVARRVTRLKLFRVLAAVRTFRNTQDLDANEPILQDPNAILRRLFVHDAEEGATLDSSEVSDPWGGAMQFVKASGATVPFINALPGWELHAPGPDGRLGTSDDIKDPFVRVVKSGSPYARAMGEDKIVDSRLDMRVGEETVGKWKSLLNEFTGTELSTGQGFGSGNGRLGGSHRAKTPSLRMGATQVTRDKSAYVFSAPVRTDKDGIARLRLPLGADETTYRVLLVALPDEAGPAASTVDVATSLPLSVRVNAGTTWIAGDAPEVAVRITNRTGTPMHATVHVSAAGAAELARGEATEIAVDLPKKGTVTVPVRIKARAEGEARILADVKGGGLTDSIEHRVGVGPNGHRMTLGRSRWVSSEVSIDTFVDDDITRIEGAPTLLLEGSFDPTLSAVMDSLDSSRLNSEDAAADAVEVFERLRRTWERKAPTLAARATTMKEQSLGRMLALRDVPGHDEGEDGTLRRANFWMKAPPGSDKNPLPPVGDCPSDKPSSAEERVRAVEGEPEPEAGGIAACWDAAVSGALRSAKDDRDPVLLAKLLLAFADRSHRQSLAVELAPELARLVALKPTGEISFGGSLSGDRSARSIVYAALLRATTLGYKPTSTVDVLIGWLLVQRAPDGGFGSAGASRAVVESLGTFGGERAPIRIAVTELDAVGDVVGKTREVTVSSSMRLPIDVKTRHVALHVIPKSSTPGAPLPGLLARLDQRALRSFSFRPGPGDLVNPVSIEVKWPGSASTDGTSSLEVRVVSKSPGSQRLVARIPLPPGASLAEPVEGVKQVDGALLVQSSGGDTSGPSVPTIIPLRFALGGELTVPEATVRSAANDAVRARALAAHIRVIGRPKHPR